MSYLRDWIYGGIDGAVTTFAVVSGVTGAELSAVIIVVLGIANLVADGFSMAASNFSGTRVEREELQQLDAIERRHIMEEPEGEREEIRQIYREKGFEGEELERVVAVITADPDRWVREMLTEEYGLPVKVRSPLLAAASTFSAFFVCGAVPIVSYVIHAPSPFAISGVATGLVFFIIGAVKSRWSPMNWWKSGLETLAIGGLAAFLAYAAGYLLRGLLQ
jgi:VIT1/CCC1 family predicted Fe2+/Mn2+ transporter